MEEPNEKCGVGLIKLLKDVSCYPDDFLTFAALRMCSKMEHRGRDGAGISIVTPDMEDGNEWMYTLTASGSTGNLVEKIKQAGLEHFKRGNVAIMHRRYSTASDISPINMQPMERYHPRPTKRIAIAWNGNLTNNLEHIERIKKVGYRARTMSDTERILGDICYALKKEHDMMEEKGIDADKIDIAKVLEEASKDWDGAYTLAGVLGNGDSFFANDQNGIRPACYAINDCLIAAASESTVLTNVCRVKPEDIKTLPRGHALIVKRNGEHEIKQFAEQQDEAHCMFEFVYLALPPSILWGKEVYSTRRSFGKPLALQIYDKIKHNDPEDIVVIAVPNTARPAGESVADELERLFSAKIKYEEGLIKDPAVGRTFIAADEIRDLIIKGAFDPIYSVIDNKIVVVVEDSTIRGTTLERDIITCLKEANPREIHAGMSCPQPRYPCPYGIDMARYNKYIAFQILVELLKEGALESKIEETYEKCKQQLKLADPKNPVIELYEQIPVEAISQRISKRLGIDSMSYQTISGLDESIGLQGKLCNACLHGKYPTAGGTKVAIQGFIDFVEKNDKRAYE